MRIKFKVWLAEEDEKLFGIGPCDILQRVAKTGSLRKAASEINMSYSQAWNLIDRLEKGLGFPLLIKQIGGKSGGGSQLTREAEQLVRAYQNFYEEAADKLQELGEKWFSDLFCLPEQESI